MKLEKGMLIRSQTKTKDDVFGDCLYEIVEVGLPAPEVERAAAGHKDGVKCVMLGGSGPSARKGLTIIDSEDMISRDIATGITEVVQTDKRAGIVSYYEDKSRDGTRRTASASGVIEMD